MSTPPTVRDLLRVARACGYQIIPRGRALVVEPPPNVSLLAAGEQAFPSTLAQRKNEILEELHAEIRREVAAAVTRVEDAELGMGRPCIKSPREMELGLAIDTAATRYFAGEGERAAVTAAIAAWEGDWMLQIAKARRRAAK